MRKQFKSIALFALLCSSAAVLSGTAMAADGPSVSKAVAKQLKAAQEDVQANKLDEALAKVKEAQGVADKTPYDSYVVDILLIQIYQKKQDLAGAIPALQAAALTQYATPEQQKTWLTNVAAYYFQQKDYAKTLEAADEALKHGADAVATLTLMAKAQYLSGKYKDAAQSMQDVVSKEEKPGEEELKLLWQFDLKVDDQAGAAKAVERLVALYPNPTYWQNALASLVRMDIKDAHLQLNVYRLMYDVGVLKLPSDYAEMADLALDQGYPGESQTVLEKAFAQNVFTEQRDKERYQHLLEGAKQRATADKATLTTTEKEANKAASGDLLVQLGAAYLSYGQDDKAVAAISMGIAKGMLKSPDEANLLLGIVQLKMKDVAGAKKSFDKVAASSNVGYARLGRLWALHAGGGAHNA